MSSTMGFRTTFTFLILTLFVCCQSSRSHSKDDEILSLLSLENKKVIVKNYYDPNKDRIILELSPTEKVCIPDARGAEVKIFQKKFVVLQLSMPGGSGEAVYNLAIICVSKGKLYKSIHVVSSVKDLIEGSSSFEVNFKDLIKKNNSFELIASVVNKEYRLQFDFDNKIFYNDFVNLNGLYNVNSDADPITHQVSFQNERYPCVSIDPAEMYIFINHRWYAKFTGNYWQMEEFSSVCN